MTKWLLDKLSLIVDTAIRAAIFAVIFALVLRALDVGIAISL